MSLAKKSITTLSLFVVAMVLLVFVAARVTHRKHKALAPAQLQKVESVATSASQPLYYSSVGASDPDSAQKSSAQRVSRYTIAVREAVSRETAESLLADLEKSGIHGFYTPVRQGDHVIYHVRIGVFASEDEAQRVASSLNQKSRIRGSVARLQ